MPKKKCLMPECERKEHSRGLCLNCYRSAAYLVRNKETTWTKLERTKKCLPRKKHYDKKGGKRKWLLGNAVSQ